ncbi:hypothetical protein AB6A40_007817 [Gnathostoma spinigerum]|uniref:Reverse transcriptase domain-containing protein n=1 Tax=Gnathostoma spinigerum TaxID=75299 RepID=A0ABD6EML4_9BILA
MRLRNTAVIKIFRQFGLNRALFMAALELSAIEQYLRNIRQQLKFLNQCKKQSLVPSFIFYSTSHLFYGVKGIDSYIEQLQRRMLYTEIRLLRSKIFRTTERISKARTNVEKMCGPSVWLRVHSTITHTAGLVEESSRRRLIRKFKHLRYISNRRKFYLSRSKNSAQFPRTHCTHIKHVTDRPINNSNNNRNNNSNAPQKVHHSVENKTTRVTCIGEVSLNQDCIDVLSLGPSFSPSLSVNKNLTQTINVAFCSAIYRLRCRHHSSSTAPTVNDLQTHLSTCAPFPRSHLSIPQPVDEFEGIVSSISHELNQFVNSFTSKRRNIHNNLSKPHRDALKELSEKVRNHEIRISTSDKGGEFTVYPLLLDKEIGLLHLSDTSTYSLIRKRDVIKKAVQEINSAIRQLAVSGCLRSNLAKRITTSNPSTPILYTLIKTHKPDFSPTSTDAAAFKVRPIISSCGGPTDKLSWFLSQILSPLLQAVPSHLSNTAAFLERLGSIPESATYKPYVYASFDVVSLYTNMDCGRAIESLQFFLAQNESITVRAGLTSKQITELVDICLRANYFSFAGTFYQQIRGVAMGNRLAPILAVLYMGYLEARSIHCNPHLYLRYIDDIFVCVDSEEALQNLFYQINSSDPNITLTIERPSKNWLPFLNTEITCKDNRFYTRWFKKPASKSILLHRSSAHSAALKHNVITNFNRTAKLITTAPSEINHTSELVSNVLRNNGYGYDTQLYLKQWNRPSSHKESPITITVPFISQYFTNSLTRIINKYPLPLKIATTPPPNLYRILVRNRTHDTLCYNSKKCIICPQGKEGDCCRKGVVYSIKCKTCSVEYIGETGRPLHVRFNEHMLSLLSPTRPCYIDKPLARHSMEKHKGKPFPVSICMEKVVIRPIDRKLAEASLIKLRNPKLNNKSEMVETLRLLPQDIQHLPTDKHPSLSPYRSFS